MIAANAGHFAFISVINELQAYAYSRDVENPL